MEADNVFGITVLHPPSETDWVELPDGSQLTSSRIVFE
jgi:hypothetical protein